MVGPVNRRTEIKMEASVAPSWPLKCILLLEGREEDGTQQPLLKMRLFLRLGAGGAGRVGTQLLCRGPAALPGFWPVTTQVLTFQAEIPRQGWSRSGAGGSPAPQAWGGEGWETPGASAWGLQPAGLDRKRVRGRMPHPVPEPGMFYELELSPSV